MDAGTTQQTKHRVDELRIAMLEASAAEALKKHPAWAILLAYAAALMDAGQRRRLGDFMAQLMSEAER